MSGKILRIGIIGGSLGGLFTGIALHNAGHNVCIYEKTSQQLRDRGAGIVLQHELIDFFHGYCIADIKEINVPIFQRVYVDKEGYKTHVDNTEQQMTAWGTIFHKLINHFPKEKYKYGYKFKSLTQQESKVTVAFENGVSETFDLLIGADGTNSSVRKIIFPEIQHSYTGYVGWRGIVQENELLPNILREFKDRFTFYHMPNSHILCYLIPGNEDEVTEGSRRLNWVWYWNVKKGKDINSLLTDIKGKYRLGFVQEGFVKSAYIHEQRQIADNVMPPIFKELIRATKNPFLQPINDLSVSRMYVNRVLLVGDAAFTPRPHTAASTAKAVANGVGLCEALNEYPDNIEQALAIWEKPQLQIGNYLKQRGMAMGNQSQFGISSFTM